MEQKHCLLDYLLNKKFRYYLAKTLDELSNVEELKKNAVTYIDSDWNVFHLNYYQLIRYSQYFYQQLFGSFNKTNDISISNIGNVEPIFVDIDSRCLNIVTIYGDCAQWTPIFMIGANMASFSFFFIDNFEKLKNVYNLVSNQFYFQMNHFVCHRYRLKELQDLLDKQFNLANEYQINKLDLIKDYLLVVIHKKAVEGNDSNKFRNDKQLINISYVINTSGTTGGLMKLIFVPHSSIVINVIDLMNEYSLTCDDTLLVCSPFTFDPSLCDTFLALCYGAHLILISNFIRNSPYNLLRLQFETINYMTITPSLWNRFNQKSIETIILSKASSLRILNFGGEQCLTINRLTKLIELKPDLKVYNLYGLSEMSVWASIFYFNNYLKYFSKSNLNPSESNNLMPISGRSIDTTQVYLNDSDGQIIIESNERKCLIFNGTCWTFDNTIKTGDIGYVLNINQKPFIYFSHRIEHKHGHELKLNGIKCNLLKIEQLLAERFDGIIIFAFAGDWHHWKSSIIELVVQMEDDNIKNRFQLKDHLLDYLIHTLSLPYAFRFHFIDTNYVTPNGKLDRIKLNELIYSKHSPMLADCVEIESNILTRIMTILNVDHLDGSIKLRHQGMSSMNALQIALEIEEFIYGNNDISEIPFDQLFDIVHSSNFQEIVNYVRDLIKMYDQYQKMETTKQLYKCKRSTSTTSDKQEEFTQNTTITLRHEWSYFMEECVDATPLIRQTDSKIHLIVASHSGLVIALNIEQTDLPQLVWSVRFLNRIEASPILSSNIDFVYIVDHNGVITCLDAENGRKIWYYKTGDIIKSTPCCVKQSIICSSYDHNLYCLCQLNGRLEWKVNVDESTILNISNEVHLNDQHCVIVSTSQGTLACLELNAGELVWQRSLSNYPIFSQASVNEQLKCAVLGLTQATIVSISTLDGHTNWEYRTQLPVYTSGSQLKMPNGEWAIVFGTHDCKVICLSIEQGIPFWIHSVATKIHSKPYLVAQYDSIIIIETNGSISLVNRINGIPLKIRCEQKEGKHSMSNIYQLEDCEIYSSPVFYNKQIYFGARDSCLHCLSIET